MRQLAQGLQPSFSDRAPEAAQAIKYRDFLAVALSVKDRRQLPDNWHHIHDPQVKLGRIQNYKSWSEEMVPDRSCACYGLEYFCFEGDGLWNSRDEELKAPAA